MTCTDCGAADALVTTCARCAKHVPLESVGWVNFYGERLGGLWGSMQAAEDAMVGVLATDTFEVFRVKGGK